MLLSIVDLSHCSHIALVYSKYLIAIYPSRFAITILIALAANVVCAELVRKRLDNLDLIAVLNTRE